MKIIADTDLRNFRSWSGASPVFYRLTTEELEQLDWILDEIYPDGIDQTELNDLFWFDTEWILSELGIEEEEFWAREFKAF